jgi:hypothetical protein
VAVDDYLLDAYVFRLKSDTILGEIRHMLRMPDLGANIESIKGRWKDRTVRFLCGNAPAVIIHEAKEIVTEHKDRFFRAYAEYRRILGRLSLLTGGVEFHFHGDKGRVSAPEAFDKSKVHVFTNCGPPGEYTDRYVATAFGKTIRDDGLAANCRGPTKGRGTVLRDGETEVVQMLGNNWYVLLTTMSTFHVGSSEIFSKIVALAWNSYRGALMSKPRMEKAATRGEYVEIATKWVDAIMAKQTDHVADLEKKIADLQQSLAFYYRVKREGEQAIEHFRSAPHLQEARRRVPKDFRRISAHPDVAKVAVVEGGIHVLTRHFIVEHKDEKYSVGDFVIRLDELGGISVWGERTDHPDGVPHPHISKDGIACFGNATEAISKAMAYHRYGDAVELVLRWLRLGYTPELAANKIEEWPIHGGKAAEVPQSHAVNAGIEESP